MALLNGSALVTGATGFVGGSLANRLVSAGLDVTCLVRQEKARELEKIVPGAKLAIGDLRDAESVKTAVKDKNYIFHIAAWFRSAGVPDSMYFEVNLGGTRNILDAAAINTASIRKVVYCSTTGVLGDVKNPPADETAPYAPADVYQESKTVAEKLAISYAKGEKNCNPVPVTILRPAMIYGAGDTRLLKLFRMVAHEKFLMVGSGKTMHHYVYIDDLVDGFILAAAPGNVGEVFTIAGPEPVTIETFATIIAEEAGVPARWLSVPAWPVQLLGNLVETICVPLGIEPPIYRRRVDYFVKTRMFDISKAKRLLGYEPKISNREGVRKTLEWYRKNSMMD